MEIKDRVYGEFVLNEPVLLELINSLPLQRLKGINQAGASQYAFDDRNVSRYEHSVGVMILLKRLGATLEEQIAGLLHDVPHTAFSHVVDFVYKNEDHSFHEKFHEKVIKNSEIPAILQKNGFNLERILDEKNFPLLEREIPDLCADRIDYTLRDLTAREGASKKIDYYLNGLIVENNEIIFSSFPVARDFAKEYLNMDYGVWSSPKEVALFQILADAIKIGLEKNILTQEDLFSEDKEVYDKLKNSNEFSINDKLSLISPKFAVKLDEDNYDFYSKNKVRYIDPKCKNGKSICRVSDLFFEYKFELEKHNFFVGSGYHIKILNE